MERVKVERISSTASSPDPLNLGKGDDNRESVIESMPSEIPVATEEKAQTNETTLAETKWNSKLNPWKADLQKKQSTLKRNKKDRKEEKLLQSCQEHHTGNNSLKNSIEMAHESSRWVKQ